MPDVALVGATGAASLTGADPNAASGGIPPDAQGAQSEVTPASDDREVQPGETAPQGQEPEQPVEGETEEQLLARETAKLTPEQRKEFTRVLTGMRQKDAEKVRAYETRLQGVQSYEQLNHLLSSQDPQERGYGIAMLRAALSMAEGGSPDPQPAADDPLAGLDLEYANSLIPGIGGFLQRMVAENQGLKTQLGQVAGTAQETAIAAEARMLDGELTSLKAWAEKAGLPFDEQTVLAKAQRLNSPDLKEAYYAAYGATLLEHGKQSAIRGLQAKKTTILPGGGTPAAGSESRPKFKTMAEALDYHKRQMGITGEIDFTGR